ncbi:MAG: hypothetical protein MUC56_13750 [Thermoanaerobaculales bacterium]|nr:hypothetical protein [Thermoanaerobaculales bacterium]
MSASIVCADYYHAMVKDQPGAAYELLSQLAGSGVSLMAFNAIPMGGDYTQLVLFPLSPSRLLKAAEEAGIELVGPQHALIVRGDDRLGALAETHRKLYDANINVFASGGVVADCGRFAYVIYVKQEDFEHAARVLDAG